jgi:hypothetical protein
MAPKISAPPPSVRKDQASLDQNQAVKAAKTGSSAKISEARLAVVRV